MRANKTSSEIKIPLPLSEAALKYGHCYASLSVGDHEMRV
jgi:hypothetical protein